MMVRRRGLQEAVSAKMTRRRLLETVTSVSVLSALATPGFVSEAFADTVSGQAEFLALSQTLTGRSSLNPGIAARAWADLSTEDSDFPRKSKALAAAMRDANFSDMRKFSDFAAAHTDLQPTAMKIISAWYLGYTGTPSMNSTVDDARFVTYAGALMYQPTIDATVIPSYSRGHTNYWFYPPKTIATD